eukprot:14988140-Alexandrium_andersonii.AAC.1
MLVKSVQLGLQSVRRRRHHGRLAPWARADTLHRGSLEPPCEPPPSGRLSLIHISEPTRLALI